MENAQNGTETILKGAKKKTTPKKNKNTAGLKCVRVVMCFVHNLLTNGEKEKQPFFKEGL